MGSGDLQLGGGWWCSGWRKWFYAGRSIQCTHPRNIQEAQEETQELELGSALDLRRKGLEHSHCEDLTLTLKDQAGIREL